MKIAEFKLFDKKFTDNASRGFQNINLLLLMLCASLVLVLSLVVMVSGKRIKAIEAGERVSNTRVLGKTVAVNSQLAMFPGDGGGGCALPISNLYKSIQSGAIYVVTSNCTKRWVVNNDAKMACGYYDVNIHDATYSDLDLITNGTNIDGSDCPLSQPVCNPFFPDTGYIKPGSLYKARNTADIYITNSDCRKYRILNADVFSACGYNSKPVNEVYSLLLDKVVYGDVIVGPPNQECPYQGTVCPDPVNKRNLYRPSNSETIYVIDDLCQKHGIASITAFNQCLYDPFEVRLMYFGTLFRLYEGSSVNVGAAWCPDAPKLPLPRAAGGFSVPIMNRGVNVVNMEMILSRPEGLGAYGRAVQEANLNYLVTTAIQNSWNPALIAALWVEESGAKDNMGYKGCMSNVKENLDCFFRHWNEIRTNNNWTNADWPEFSWTFCGRALAVPCSNNAVFYSNLRDIYYCVAGLTGYADCKSEFGYLP